MGIPISAAGGAAASSPAQPARRGDELGKQEFLLLLVEQLRNQDPMNPISDREFIAQLAQFSGLEAMQGMAGALNHNRAVAMVGKHVTAVTEGGWVEGRVESVLFDSGRALLEVAGSYVAIEDVVEISE